MKNIKVNIPDGHVIDTENSDLEKGIITFKKEESKYPMELVDVNYVSRVYHDKNSSDPGSRLIYKYCTFIQLVETCKEWNRIDGFEADWEDKNYFAVINDFMDGSKIESTPDSRALFFKDRDTAELFLETFREEIELVKDLI